MQWISRISISKKLAISSIVSAIFIMFVGFLAISQIDKINESSLELKEKWLPKVQLVMDMKVNLTRFSEQQLMHVLAHDEASWRIHEAKMQEIAADDRKAYEKYAR